MWPSPPVSLGGPSPAPPVSKTSRAAVAPVTTTSSTTSSTIVEVDEETISSNIESITGIDPITNVVLIPNFSINEYLDAAMSKY